MVGLILQLHLHLFPTTSSGQMEVNRTNQLNLGDIRVGIGAVETILVALDQNIDCKGGRTHKLLIVVIA